MVNWILKTNGRKRKSGLCYVDDITVSNVGRAQNLVPSRNTFPAPVRMLYLLNAANYTRANYVRSGGRCVGLPRNWGTIWLFSRINSIVFGQFWVFWASQLCLPSKLIPEVFIGIEVWPVGRPPWSIIGASTVPCLPGLNLFSLQVQATDQTFSVRAGWFMRLLIIIDYSHWRRTLIMCISYNINPPWLHV